MESLACLLVLAVLPRRAANAQEAQAGTPAEQVEQFCDRAKHGQTTATRNQDKIANIVALQDCGEEGVRLLADYWRQPDSDHEVTATLASVSARLNDRRIYESARAVALDPSRGDQIRLDALSVMVSGYDPTLAVAFLEPSSPSGAHVALGHRGHANQKEGRQPVKAYARKDLPEVLTRLARSDRSQRISKSADEVQVLIARRDSSLRTTRSR